MSRPYQFTDRDDKITSPLDRRQPSAFPPGQPPSFKTNVNRAKTKKWVEAKSVSYGGDDWDDYDEDDEYGVQSAVEEQPPPAAASTLQGRSFTTPVPSTSEAPPVPRKNSFDQDDERRAFSATVQSPRSPGPPLQVDTHVPPSHAQPTDSESQYSTSGLRQASAASFAPSNISDSSVNPEHRRDFSPSALPQPLTTGAVALPASSTQTSTQSPTSSTRAFIRPAEIYRRMEEEREKERRSLESSRQSTESARSQDVTNTTKAREQAQTTNLAHAATAPLETVAERKSEYGLLGSGEEQVQPAAGGISLPGFEPDTGFGKSFWDSPTNERQDQASAQVAQESAPIDQNLHHQPSAGYRSMVNQAFDAPSKVSKQDSTRTDSSGLTRSDTSGTSDISPIMSRVPSSATSAVRHADQMQAPPAIPEEPDYEERGRSEAVPEGSVPANITPGYRRDLNAPSGNNSPARSPAMEANRELHLPTSAEVATPDTAGQPAIALREADLAVTAAPEPDEASANLATMEKSAQDNFLVSSHDVPASASPSIARAESPSKGRVAEIAGKLNNAEDSRRNSAHSISSKKSASSLKDSNSRPSSSQANREPLASLPTERPITEREASFRPKIPGGFDSFASVSETSAPQTTGMSAPKDQIFNEVQTSPPSESHVADGKGLSEATGPMAALAAAGAAVAASIQKSVSGDNNKQDEHNTPTRLTGDIYNRPLPPDRLESTGSTIPPTPPVKDVADKEIAAPPVPQKDDLDIPKFERQSTAESSTGGDFESDRLRRDIVRSLSPIEDKAEAQGLQISTDHAADRKSDGVLSEYESYWHSEDEEQQQMSASALPTFSPAPLTPKSTKGASEPVSEKAPPVPVIPAATSTVPAEASASPSTQPGFLTQRFSWETTPADSPAKEIPEPNPGAPGPAIVPQAAVVSSSQLKPEDPLSLNPKLSGEHLQIRNAEPGDISSPVEGRSSSEALQPVTPKPASENLSPVREAPAGPRSPSGNPQDLHDIRPPSFREILAIKSTTARIAKYNETRTQFASMDTGLSYWLQRTVADNPQLQQPAQIIARPTAGVPVGSSPGGVRHKATASLTKVFTNQGGSAPGDPSVPEYTASPSQQRTSSGGFTASGLKSVKGKDLLNKAGVLGGKGMKEAKGLFTKGKSRFRGGEKDSFEIPLASHRGPLSRSIPSTPSSVDSFDLPSWRTTPESSPQGSRRSSLSLSTTSRRVSFELNSVMSVKSDGMKKPDGPEEPDPLLWVPDEFFREPLPITVMTMQFWRESRRGAPVTDGSKDSRTQKNAQRPKTPQRDQEPPRLGVLPSPAMGGFGGNARADTAAAAAAAARNNSLSDDLVQSVVRNSPSPRGTGLASLPSRQAQAQAQAASTAHMQGSRLTIPDAGWDGNSHQRIVSLIQPGDAANIHDGMDDEPVSPISDEDERVRESNAGDAKIGGASQHFAAGGPAGGQRTPTPGNSTPSPQLMYANLHNNNSSAHGSLSPGLHTYHRGSSTPSLVPSVRSYDTDSDAEPPPGAPRSQSSQPRLPGTLHPNSSAGHLMPPTASPMLRPQTVMGVMDGGRASPRVSFALDEPKGKEKVTTTELRSGSSTPVVQQARHIRFDSSTFHPRAKEVKLKKAAEEQTKRQQAAAAAPTSQRQVHFQQTVMNQQKPGQQQRANAPNAGPQSGSLSSGLRRADSQYDRMAAIANAHRAMREQFDDVDDVAHAPPDLMASETAAKMHAKQEEMMAIMSGAINGIPIPPIPEDRPQSRDGRTRSRTNSIVFQDDRSRSRERRQSIGHTRDSSAGRASIAPLPRLLPTGGPRASSIPRPESIISLPPLEEVGRPRSYSRPSTRDGPSSGPKFGQLTQIQGLQSPTAGLGVLQQHPKQSRPISQTAVVVNSIGGQQTPPLGGGPGPTLRYESPSKAPPLSAPSMIITEAEQSEENPTVSPPNGSQAPGPRDSVGARSHHSVSSLGDGTDRSGDVSPTGPKPQTSPVKKNFESRAYKAPDPSRKRPMSFVPLARDDRGLPVAEVISTAKHPVELRQNQEQQEQEATHVQAIQEQSGDEEHYNPPNPALQPRPLQIRQTSANVSAESLGDLYKPPTPHDQDHIPRPIDLPPRSSSISPLHSRPLQLRPVQLYDRPYSRDGIRDATTQPPAAPPAQQAVPDANPIAGLQTSGAPTQKKGGLLSKLKKKNQSTASLNEASHSHNSSRDTTSSSEQRLSSLTSTVTSVDVDKDVKRKRGSGLFVMQRPGSVETQSTQTTTSQYTDSPSQYAPPHPGLFPPHAQVKLMDSPTSATSPQRATTTTGDVATKKKRRLSLGGVFARAASTNSHQATKEPELPKSTVFHKVPQNPNENASGTQKKAKANRRKSGQGQGSLQLITENGKPFNGQFDPDIPKHSFEHGAGSSGMAAIAAQQHTKLTKERRSMSLSGVGLFSKRHSSQSSSGSAGHGRSNSDAGSTKNQSPNDSPPRKKGLRRLRMGSISETNQHQHQERPWAITLPGSEENDNDREIERREIMHASSARWQRGADGQMYALQEQHPPTSPGPQRAFAPQGTQSDQIYSYLPSGLPGQQRSLVERDQARIQQQYYQPTKPPAQQVPYQDHFPRVHPRGPQNSLSPSGPPPSQPIIPPLPQDSVPLRQPQPRRGSWQRGIDDPRLDPSYRSQGGTSRASSHTASVSPHVTKVQQSSGPPKLPLSFASHNPINLENVGAATTETAFDNSTNRSTNLERLPSSETNTSVGRESRGPAGVQRGASSSSTTAAGPASTPSPTPSSSSAPQRNFIAALEEERRKYGDHSAMGYSGSKAKQRANLAVTIPVTSGGAPAQVGTFTAPADAVASAGVSGPGRHRRNSSDESNDMPVMKATSYPGDEWMPDFYAD